MELVADVYLATLKLPDAERFGLVSQLRRAAVSVPSVFAEGHSRGWTREFIRYVSMAMGSLAEIETQLLICRRLGFLKDTDVHELLESCGEQSRIMGGLKRSLTSRLRGAP